MKKNKLIIATAALAAILLLSSCSIGGTGFGTFSVYANSELYTAGDRTITDKITSVDVNWNAGGLVIKFEDTDEVRIIETNSPSDDSYKVHSYVDGDTLKIQYAASGVRSVPADTLRKSLTVILPAGTEYSRFKVYTASSNLECLGVNADKLELMTASGDLTVEGKANKLEIASASGNVSFTGEVEGEITCDTASGDLFITSTAKTIDINSSSGDINLVQTGTADIITLTSISGVITANSEKAPEIKVSSSSGNITLRAADSDQIIASTSSGDVHVGVTKMTDIKATASSGDVILSLPATAGFSASVTQSSGYFTSDFAVKTEGNKLVCGDGSASLIITTSSGNVSLKTGW